ncbi:MAG TPA: hypothetical protein DIC52_13000 [Candidatus Latescibacteria bacterium]|nr:hypothetical protein [Candidatus Latescibacterota bacterium]
MTRFLYISDTHWGSGDTGYTMQPKYDHELPALLAALQDWIEAHGPIDFLLHGGDMIHEMSADNIRQAAAWFDLPLPIHLCLGNHDLTAHDSVDTWMALAPQFFPEASTDFTIKTTDCMIHVIPNQYGPTPFLWDRTQDPHFLDSQIQALEQRLDAAPDTTHLILTHSPVHDLPQAQSGLDKPFHQPLASFTDCVVELAEKYDVPCVLGAHSHVNMNKELNGVNYITVSPLVETPFEFKLFEVLPESLTMETHNLWDRMDVGARYNWNSTFVQGRACDRSFHRTLTPHS